MRSLQVIAVSIALAPLVQAAPQPESLVRDLRAMYPETELDNAGLRVVKPGTVLVVQANGVMANPLKSGPFTNTFAGGQFVRTETRSEKAARFGINVPQKRPVDRPIATGAKVYLLKTEFSSDAIDFTVQTCGDCDPKTVDPGNEPYRAKVVFKFVRGALAETDAKHVRQTIEQVFTFANPPVETAPPLPPVQAPPPPPVQAPAPPQPQPEQFAPITAPAPAPPVPATPLPAEPAPKVLKLGMTTKQVKDSFGEPASIVDLGSKVIYVYKDKKVTFVNGKVSDVDVK